VVVAARAAQGHAQEALADDAHLVVELVERGLLDVVGLGVPHAQAPEARGHDGLAAGVRQLVARELLQHEAVVGHVLVEGVDDPVAVAPGAGLLLVALVAVGLAPAHHVQPVAAPALAVLGPGQQRVDQARPGVGRRVVHEGLHLLGAGRQPEQVEPGPARQRGAVGGRVGLQSLLLQLREHEGVDRVGHALAGGDGRRLGPLDRAEGPPLAAGRDVGAGGGLVAGVVRRAGLVRGPRCAQGHPLHQCLDLRRAELAVRRHAQVGIHPADGLDQAALLGLAGRDGGAALAAAQQGRPAAHAQAALDLFQLGAVALEAVLREQRPHLVLEEHERVVVEGLLGAGHFRINRRRRDLVSPGGLDQVVGPRGAQRHPALDRGHVLRGQRLLWRHGEVGIGAPDGHDQQARLGIAGHDGRAAIAAVQQRGAAIEHQPAADARGQRPVALEAVLLQDREHPLAEQRLALRVGTRTRGREADRHHDGRREGGAESSEGRHGAEFRKREGAVSRDRTAHGKRESLSRPRRATRPRGQPAAGREARGRDV
jgi:hypothetical protein